MHHSSEFTAFWTLRWPSIPFCHAVAACLGSGEPKRKEVERTQNLVGENGENLSIHCHLLRSLDPSARAHRFLVSHRTSGSVCGSGKLGGFPEPDLRPA